MPQIVPADYCHLQAIADDIRDYDAAECAMFLGKKPPEAMRFMLERANLAGVVMHHDRPAVMFGYNVVDAIHRVAAPFLVITNYAVDHPFLFARNSGRVLEFMKGYYLVNFVQAKNDVAIKWLEWMGFYLAPEESYQGIARVRRFSKDLR